MATIVQENAPTVPIARWRAIAAKPGVRAVFAVAGGAATVGGGVLLATSGHLVHPVEFGIEMGICIAGAVAAGLVWLARRAGNLVGLWLLALALASAGITLQGASDPLLHSIGVLFDPVFFLLGYVCIFAFPEGRLTGRPERLLIAALCLYFLVEFVPWAFFSPVISGGAPLAGCAAACPPNALMIADRPGVAAGVGDVVYWLAIVLMAATLVCLTYRLAQASRPRRRTLLPVYLPAVALTVPILAFHGLAAGVLDLRPGTQSAIGWVLTLARCLMPFGFLLAIALASLFAGSALKRLMAALGGNPSASRLREIVAAALDDPAVELAFRVDGSPGFTDSRGEPLPGVVARDGRATSIVARQGETVGAIWHDRSLNSDPELIQAASQAMLLALDNGRLEAELAASRSLLEDAEQGARREVERNLHDGAQQQLIALQIKVALAREVAPQDSELGERLADVGYRLDDVLHELRELASGARPPLLRDLGLSAALASAVRRTTPPAELEASGITRYPDAVETAVYFCCLESLQNVSKHAGAGVRAYVRLYERVGELRFEVTDRGVGSDLATGTTQGAGLANMRERVAALGGNLTVDTAVGRGTRILGSVPVR